ncbi:hypothetical protein GFL88_24785 [Rhizobium leguminosarum bv. viciae]|uniref:hypothetical protein n=1 Tax=Rhizobium leguminosarum TaxID=384 RepID=UPI00144296B7|nr:hypothetical protein [Rhizobium leguminosarum]NKK66688.1 hypothetical protein [Rhizobium leguminosarum bv. viciae]
MEEFLIGLSGFALGWLFCRTVWKGRSDSTRFVAEKLNRDVDEAEMRYLECLRRELANEMMAEDTETTYQVFHKMRQYEKDLKKDGKQRIDADFKSICMKYPSFQEFDPFGTRHFIDYQDARSSMDISDLVDRYSDISQFLIINAARKNLPWELFDDKEAEQLNKAIRKRKDRVFRKRMLDAMGRYHVLMRALRNVRAGDDVRDYDDGVVSVRPVSVEYSPGIG